MRKAKPKKRIILPDPVFNDVKVSKFVNHLMYDGKKNTSYEIFYAALETVKNKMQNEEKSALEIWKKALDNVTPQVEVKSRRVGGALNRSTVERIVDILSGFPCSALVVHVLHNLECKRLSVRVGMALASHRHNTFV